MIGVHSGDRLPESMMTAPELLAKVGYQTIGVSENGYAGEAKGIDERFEDFTKSAPSSLTDFLTYQQGRNLIEYAFKSREHGPGLTLDIEAHKHQNALFTTNITKRKLKQAAVTSEPFFCYVHYNDPHHTYAPPLAYREEYLDDLDTSASEAVEFAERMHEELFEWMADGLPLSEREWKMLYAMYDATIRYTDSQVGELFDFVQEHFEDTIVIVTADHGELFGEQGLLGHHIVLEDALIHVPLITHGLDGVSDHTDRPTQHIDVMQTALNIAGADTSQFQGYDLRHESRDIAISQDLRSTIDEDDTENYERIRKHNPEVDLSHLPESMVTAARTTDFKFVQTEEWTRLHSLPDETTDGSDQYRDTRDELATFLSDWLETEGEPFEDAPKKADLTEETQKHLEDMGYM